MTDTSKEVTQLRTLLENEWSANQELKQTLAQTLHNHVGQQLTVMKMHLNLVEMKLENSSDKELKEVGDRLSAIEETINTLAEDIRGLVTQLWPEVLEHFGLVAALDWKITHLGSDTGVETSVESSDEQLPLKKKNEQLVFYVVTMILDEVISRSDACKVIAEEKEKAVDIIINLKGSGLKEVMESDEYELWRTAQREFLTFGQGKVSHRVLGENEYQIVLSIPTD